MIRYAYLWSDESRRGLEEGVKDRPCAVILVTQEQRGDQIVTVLPITHSEPNDANLALEIPSVTKKRLGLDPERSWVVLSEANQFTWPGPDLRPATRGDADSVAYGLLPAWFIRELRTRFIAALRARRAALVTRSE